ncbi:SDR family oxidoreductase [Oceanobacillus luteolus]|uniref:SDR family oxidoreductase n=1 Tax=Oceanobacillus luteolus TaxID=1274358 RepID=A0ABW4HMY7_9BACI
MTGRFAGKVAVVTGGSRGIGKAVAKEFAEEGAKVAILDVDENLYETEKEFIDNQYEFLALRVDITDEQQTDLAIEQIAGEFGSVDILVNNAGITRDDLLFKMSSEHWRQVLDVHLTGSFHVTKAAQKYMVEQKYGRIINISSRSALGNRGQANYAAAKAGLQGFTKTLAIELGKFGITVNSVAPGFIETEMTKATAERVGKSFEEFKNERIKQIPVGRGGKPEDIANAVAFFADEKASFVNGQVMYVAGGPAG